jgi:hypothetical protein
LLLYAPARLNAFREVKQMNSFGVFQHNSMNGLILQNFCRVSVDWRKTTLF